MIKNMCCKEGMREMADNSVDSIVTDPPYELSNDGKQSTARIFSEFMFPENPKIKSLGSGHDELPFFVKKVSELGNVGAVPEPSAAMPISAVAFNNNSSIRDNNIVNSTESSVNISSNGASRYIEPDGSEYLGCFYFELADRTKFIKIINEVGSGFFSGRIGIGLGVNPSGFSTLSRGGESIVSFSDDISASGDSLSNLISTFTGTTSFPMFSFDLTGVSNEVFSANGARFLFSLVLASGSKLIRTNARTSSLPSIFKTTRICVIDDITNRAFSFDLIVHSQIISSSGFMGKEWDGSKIAYDIEMWAECLRVLKPGGYLLAFSASRTYHRMTVAIEDAGFDIRDSIMWVYSTGFPKHKTHLKPAHEPICVARKPLSESTVAANVLLHGTGAVNIDGCRVGGESTVRVSGSASIGYHGGTSSKGISFGSNSGRWPANFIHDGLDEEWSRYFYCAKASKYDRGEDNNHPTVKPSSLMEYLCRLVTPPGGLILDPFSGSGSTGKAAIKEGFRFVGFEKEAQYCSLANARMSAAAASFSELV